MLLFMHIWGELVSCVAYRGTYCMFAESYTWGKMQHVVSWSYRFNLDVARFYRLEAGVATGQQLWRKNESYPNIVSLDREMYMSSSLQTYLESYRKIVRRIFSPHAQTTVGWGALASVIVRCMSVQVANSRRGE